MKNVRNLCLSAALLLILTAANAVELANNGSFETNGGVGSTTFSNWTVIRENSSSGVSGNFFAQSGTRSPSAKLDVASAPAGSFAAMTDQSGPGRTAIYQDISVPATGEVWLALRLFVLNQTDDFATPASLDYNVVPNQQVRVDVMNPASGVWDVGAGVLSNAFVTQPGATASSSVAEG